MNLETTIKLLNENMDEIRKFGVISIGVFGSVVRNEAGEGSDIDILVEYQENTLNLNSYMNLKFYLEKLFKCSVDLVTKDSVKPYLKEKILRDVVYAA